jgi:hypothetical protein
MFVLTSDVRGVHFQIINYHAKVAGPWVVILVNIQSIEIVIPKHHPAMHDIPDDDFALQWVVDTHCRACAAPHIDTVAASTAMVRLIR